MSSQAAVANDGQEPGSRVALAVRLEVTKRAQHRVLHGILGVVLVAEQIASERVRIVQMRQHDSLEALDVVRGHL